MADGLTRRLFAKTALVAPLAFAQSSLPEPIARLKSRKSEAKPITSAEREGRVERARQLMMDNGVDAIVIAGGTSLRYFAGMRWGNSERLFAYVIPRKGQPFFVSPAFEEERAREQAGAAVRVVTWQEDEDPYALLGKSLKDLGLSESIGIEERTLFAYSDGIAKSNPGFKVVSANAVTVGCRARKSPAELALMKLANSVTLEAFVPHGNRFAKA